MPFSSPKPLFRIGRFPIGITEFIILLELIGMLCVVFTQQNVLRHVIFTPEALLAGQIWRTVTYAFFSSLDPFLLLGLFFFYQFGRNVETSLGTRSFLILCLSIILCAPLLALLATTFSTSTSSILLGNHALHLAIFCAFCVMHPNLPTMFLQIPIKWLGLAAFILATLGSFQSGGFTQLLIYLVSTTLALIMVQHHGLALIKVIPDNLVKPKIKKAKVSQKTKAKKRVEPKLKPKMPTRAANEIDRILDKISAQGLHSLTDQERETLQKQKK